MTKEISLTQGKVAIVDDGDYERLSQFSWFAHKNKYTFYAQRNSTRDNGKPHMIHMHHVVLGTPAGIRVDHIDADGLNNTRANLRPATYQQNNQNRRMSANNTSGYKGVSWHKGHKKWIAQIHVDGKLKHLGYFATAQQAAFFYDTTALKVHGEFARLNCELAFAIGLAGALGGVEL